MKKVVLIGVAGIALVALAGVIVFGTIAAKEETGGPSDVSPKAAKVLQQKIDAVKDAENNPKHKNGSSRVEVSEVELESYLLYSLKEDIPARIDSADVQLAQDTVALDTQITFS